MSELLAHVGKRTVRNDRSTRTRIASTSDTVPVRYPATGYG